MKHKLVFLSISLIIILSMLGSSTTSTAQSPQSSVQPQVDLGEPGLSYRYVSTLGELHTPYLADTEHLNGPFGLFMDASDNLYVTEREGYRVLKYDSTPSNVWALGMAGNSAWDVGWGENILNLPRDVALDNDGNVWIADGNRMVEYTSVYTEVVYQQEFRGDDNHPLSDVWGVAFDTTGRMYVSDSNNQVVQVYSFIDGSPVYSTTIGVMGEPGDDNTHFDAPRLIALDATNRLFVTDTNNGRVQQCTYAGGWSCISLDSGLSYPEGIVVDNLRNVVYIADFPGSGRIRKCSLEGICEDFITGTWECSDLAVDTAGNVYGTCPGCDSTVHEYDINGQWVGVYLGVEGVPYLTDGNHYNRPKVSIDAAQNILITEELGHRLIKLDSQGNFLWAFGVPGQGGDDENHLNHPMIPATDGNGNIYVPNSWGCFVKILSPDGGYLDTLGTGCGTGDYEFNVPFGVAVDHDGNIYVADMDNDRIAIYDQSLTYIGQIGETGVCDTADSHLCGPQAVAVDAAGYIYVADSGNMRVQKFNRDLELQMTIGTGTWGKQFDQFAVPNGITVDAQGKIYVSEWQNYRVQVFDASGAYLTTIGGAWGTNTAQFNGISSVAVDSEGNVYVSDVGHRIQKYAPGVPDWKQVNINGFGDVNTTGTSLDSFAGNLYAGVHNRVQGTQIWRTSDGTTWEPMTESGIGIGEGNNAILDMIEFNGMLYAATGWNPDRSAELWRTPDGETWEDVLDYGDTGAIDSLGVYGNQLYAGASEAGGVSIYRSSTGDLDSWEPVVILGNGNPNNSIIDEFVLFTNQFYALGQNLIDGAFVWQASEDGDIWTQVNQPGFDNTKQVEAVSGAVFNGTLYVGTCSVVPCEAQIGQIWSSTNGTDWSPVVTDGFGDENNGEPDVLYVFDGALFTAVRNQVTGMQVWRTMDGADWVQVNLDGWGDSNSFWSLRNNATTSFNDKLYLGLFNNANGTEVWRYEPSVTAGFTATPTIGAVPLMVTFTNTSSGTLTANLWDFGDGITSTLTSPVHIYDVVGVYTVTLTADSFGNTDTIIMPALITVEYQKFFLPVINR